MFTKSVFINKLIWNKLRFRLKGIYMGGSPMLVAHDAEILKEINIKQFSKFPRREPNSGTNTALGKIAVDFMTGTEGPQWRRQR